MDKFGLLGGKLGHSLSPAIHKLFFQYTGKEGTYDLLETELSKLPERMEQLRQDFVGSNVTIPHKINVMPLLDGIAKEAEAIGAVNTIKFTEEGAFGYNTDYFGFGRMLEYNDIPVRRSTCAVLGSGGAARAVVKYLDDQGAAKIYLVTRDIPHVDKHFKAMCPRIKIIDYERLETICGELLVNCTPVGMYPKVNACPVSPENSNAFGATVDLIYNPQETVLLKQAKAAGNKAVNGLFMLVAQAVAAQEIWQGERYDAELIIKIMQGLEAEL